ncbi:GntR family transcriptional regulator [Sphaerisporangium krabiense]|uniref:DNA-binding GntR family transcriptional regulator n=1 Tax=Sphaerisporangium krabiense TaxID=763782 RepID=A0A7W9DPC0_9ACTN|nr:GntR family transcriptional regulator [Sphaerisporangium krabiense]MBB5625914.1 DNA-binding GntR family transcriptional regulator [Sphaerisporangium krabiense]GII64717.1 GntR family transcriptional regulator [Sphaerisporangium krabiense]
MARTARSSKVDQAYEIIKNRITDDTYGPGTRLVFDQLARDLDISAVPVREAVRRLEAEGWVTYQLNVGAQVATFDVEQYRAAMEALALLEGYATATAVPHIDDQTLRKARALNDQMRNALPRFDPLAFTRLNHAFHALLCEKSPNLHVRGLLEREWQRLDLLRRTSFSMVPRRAGESVHEHDTLLHLIAASADRTTIEIFSRRHKLNTLRAVAQQP